MDRLLRRCAGHGCARAAAVRSRLCTDCRDLLAERLSRLPAHYAALELGRTPGTPLPPRVVEARTAVRGALVSWAHVVVTGRVVPRPARSVPGLADFLCRHVDWLGAHPAAADIAVEIADLLAPLGHEVAA